MTKVVMVLLTGGLVALFAVTAEAGGWYLLTPPVNAGAERNPSAGAERPLAHWNQIAAFNTAAECQKEFDRRTFLLAGLCVASDDPRLAQTGCTAQPDENSLARARQEGRDELAWQLAAVRTLTDVDSLRAWVAAGQAGGARPEDIALGLLAGARLLELQTGGQRAPTPSPQDIRR
jgi:hypothetical protein